MLTERSLNIISLGYFYSESDTFSCATEIKIPMEKGCHTGSLFITHHKCQTFLLSYRGPEPWEEKKKKQNKKDLRGRGRGRRARHGRAGQGRAKQGEARQGKAKKGRWNGQARQGKM